MKLTSAQEAAFNAAGEVMADLEHKITLSRHPGANGQFFAFGNDPRQHRHDSVFGDSKDTAAEAVQSLLDKIEAIKTAPPKLETAKEAVAAVRAAAIELANEGNDGEGSTTVDVTVLAARIDALPVA